jgi:chemotaxis protein histidine kinase CheA
MKIMHSAKLLTVGWMLVVGVHTGWTAKKAEPQITLNAEGERLAAKYAGLLQAIQKEIAASLPRINERTADALKAAQAATKLAQQQADEAQQALGKVHTAKALVDHAKGKWIGGAEKGIAQAQAALKKATTDAEREAANKELAKWQANKEDGLKALQERQAAWDKARADEPNLAKAKEAAEAALAQAKSAELNAFKAVLAGAEPLLSSEKLDMTLVKGTVLAAATPRALASFAQQDKKNEALIEKLLADGKLMRDMLVAGGASGGRYGDAMQIFAAIQQASPKARDGLFYRLALATSLEHAVPIEQNNAEDQKNAPQVVDPVKRYLHYEKAYLNGELDPAFDKFSAWEYRMVVDCDAPDEILTWGRQMLRIYRPDHVTNPDYGWRYTGAVKSDVRYGSQNVKDDLPSLNSYQNIPRNGGVCGRRAFFGRFIAKSFGMPTWGVTQHKHAALSHWTPKGWVVNLGAGFNHSWWDKDDAPRSGASFLLETQARERGQDYLKVLRAQWVSRILGEEAFNDRKKVAGGFWSRLSNDLSVAIAGNAVALGPLGQELAEANEPESKRKIAQEAVKASDQQVTTNADGSLTVPAVAHGKPSGSGAAMKSFSGGMQMHCSGGFKTSYLVEAPQAGKYALTARVATLQEGQKFRFSVNDVGQSIDSAVPYTIGLWQQTRPVEVVLTKGRNTIGFEIEKDSRGVTIKDFNLTPVK